MRLITVGLMLALCLTVFPLGAQTVTPNFATGLGAPWGILIDSNNNLYVSDHDSGNIYKFASAGGAVTGGAAGTAFATSSGGAAGMVLDNSRNLYLALSGGNIQKYASVGGVVTGGAGAVFATGLDELSGLVLDHAQNLYASSDDDGAIFKFPSVGGAVTGGAAGAAFATVPGSAYDLILDNLQNLYVTSYSGNIYKFASSGGAVTGGAAGAGFITGLGANNPIGLALDGSQNLYVIGYINSNIFKFASSGGAVTGGAAGAAWVSTGLNGPVLGAIDNQGNLFVANFNGGAVTKISGVTPLTYSNGPTSVPALGDWGMMALAVLLAGTAVLGLRARNAMAK